MQEPFDTLQNQQSHKALDIMLEPELIGGSDKLLVEESSSVVQMFAVEASMTIQQRMPRRRMSSS